MSKKLIPKCLTAWTPIYRTNINPFELDENLETLLALAKATESYRNGEIDEKQQQKRRQAFANAMLAGAMAEDPAVMTASGWRLNEDGNFVLDLVDNPGVKALRNNLAVLGATTLAAPAAGYIGSEAVAMGWPWWRNFIGEAAIGNAGWIATNEAYKGLSGKLWSQGIRDILPEGPKWIPDETKTMLADMTNPGGWLSFGMARQIGTGLNNTLNNFTHYGKNLIRRGKKYITGNKRFLDLSNRMNDYVSSLLDKELFYRDIYNRVATVYNNESRLLREQLISKTQELDNILQLEDMVKYASRSRDASFFISPFETRLKFTGDFGDFGGDFGPTLRTSTVDFEKLFDPRFNPNADILLKDLNSKGLINVDGTISLPVTGFHYPNLNTGEVVIPKFGTDDVFTFNIATPKSNASVPISNYSTKNRTALPTTDVVEIGNDPLPEEYVLILKHNIEYVLNKFPGTRAYGSAVGSAESGLPHRPNDVELYITDSNFDKLVKDGLQIKSTKNPETFKVELDDGRYSTMGTIDMNIVRTKPDGTLDFTSDRSLNLFRLLFPDEYQKTYLAYQGNRKLMYHPMKAQDLLDRVSVDNTIMDTFESSKDKHIPRALWYINRGNPDLVYEALIKHGNSLVGENMMHAPVYESMFTDPQYNLHLLKRMRLGTLENLEKIANDPKRMKLIFEYWWLNNTVLSRGTSVENMPLRIANELGVFHEKNFGKYYKRNMTEWSGGVGGDWSGTGLNTVKFGDSGGGTNGNHIYGQLLPTLVGYREGMTPDELMDLVANNYPHANQTLPNPIEYNGTTLNTYGDILALGKTISPKDLDMLSRLLGIRGIVGGDYNSGQSYYVGVTSPVTREGDVLFVNPASDERHFGYVSPTNDHARNYISYYVDNPWVDAMTNRYKHDDAYRKLKPKYKSGVLQKIVDIKNGLMDEIETIKGAREDLMDIDTKRKSEIKDALYANSYLMSSILRKKNITLPILRQKALKTKSNIAKASTLIGTTIGLGSFIGHHSDKTLPFDGWNYYNNEIQNILKQYDIVEGPWKEKFENEEDIKKKHLMLLRLVKNGHVKLKTSLKAKGGKLIPKHAKGNPVNTNPLPKRPINTNPIPEVELKKKKRLLIRPNFKNERSTPGFITFPRKNIVNK